MFCDLISLPILSLDYAIGVKSNEQLKNMPDAEEMSGGNDTENQHFFILFPTSCSIMLPNPIVAIDMPQDFLPN